MTLCKTVLLDFNDEMAATRRMLERVPLSENTAGYKPHEKSMRLDWLASHVAEIPAWPAMALEAEEFVLPENFERRVAGSPAELLAIFDASAQAGRAAIETATDEAMARNWTFRFGDKFSYTAPRPKALRSFLNHLVHHRAQLGTYLRMLDVPVPGMYGPTADEPRA